MSVKPATFFLASLLLVWAGWVTPAATHKPVPKKKTSTTVTKSTAGKAAPKTTARKTAPVAHKKAGAAKMTPASHSTTPAAHQANSRYRKGTQRPVVAPKYYTQTEPAPDRYREIQQALAQRGYLSGEPSGRWDASSAEALRRFQQDQKLEASGKLDSLSLIALGLGPKRASSSQAGPQ